MAPKSSATEVVTRITVPSMITTTISNSYPDFNESLQLSTDAMDFEDNDDADASLASFTYSHSHPDCHRIEESPSFGTSTTVASPLTSNSTHTSPSTPPQPFASSQNVRVNVGGEFFSFPQSAFQRFHGLPWKRDREGVLHLNSSAAVFEVLLDYILFETLPAYDTMSDDEFQEFETMALSIGGLNSLIEHYDRKNSYLAKELRQPKQRNNFSFNSKKQGHFLLNGEQSHKSPNSVRATQCARFLGAICGVAESMRRRPRQPGSGEKTANKRLKLAPGQWCRNGVN